MTHTFPKEIIWIGGKQVIKIYDRTSYPGKLYSFQKEILDEVELKELVYKLIEELKI